MTFHFGVTTGYPDWHFSRDASPYNESQRVFCLRVYPRNLSGSALTTPGLSLTNFPNQPIYSRDYFCPFWKFGWLQLHTLCVIVDSFVIVCWFRCPHPTPWGSPWTCRRFLYACIVVCCVKSTYMGTGTLYTNLINDFKDLILFRFKDSNYNQGFI